MVKTLLIQPPTHTVETFSTIGMTAPPMGLAYLAAMLEKHNFSVEILDCPALCISFESLGKEIESRRPDIIGITATTATVTSGLKTAKIAKSVLPNSTVVFGGAHFTFMPEYTMRENDSIDIGCIGEGEYTFLDLVQSLEKGGDLNDVQGIIYRLNEKIVRTSPRPYISNLDELPFPARHLLPMDKYSAFGKKMPFGTILTSRGCPFGCTFCSSSLLFGKKFRARSAENVVDEVEHFQNTYNNKNVEFIDDTFTVDWKRVKVICDEMLERKLDTTWVCSCRVDLINKDILQWLKKSGCKMIYFGVESGVQRVINLMKKGIKIDQALKVMKWSREVGIETVASFVIGIPGETWEDAIQTIKFAKKIDADYVQFSIATPFPGTELYNMAKDEGLLLTEDWSRYTVLKPVMKTKELSPEQLQKLIRKAYFQYYLRPKIIFRYIKKGLFKEVVVNAMGRYMYKFLKSKIKI